MYNRPFESLAIPSGGNVVAIDIRSGLSPVSRYLDDPRFCGQVKRPVVVDDEVLGGAVVDLCQDTPP